MNKNEANNTSVALEIIRASEITPKEVQWLWYPYIPYGKITLLQGDPGDGKSKFMLALSAETNIKEILVRGKVQALTDNSFVLTSDIDEGKDIKISVIDKAGNKTEITVRLYDDHVMGEYEYHRDATYHSNGTQTAFCIHGCGAHSTNAKGGTMLDSSAKKTKIEVGAVGTEDLQ